MVLHAPPEPAQQALELILKRKDRRALQRLVFFLDRLSPPLRQRLQSLGEELGSAIREAYLHDQDQPYQNACELILDLPAYDQIALVLGSIHHQSQRKQDAEHLIRKLGEKLAAELDGEESSQSRADMDRVRRQFLESLEPALARFAHHKLTVIPEMFLLLADDDSELVKRILMEPTHTCHGPMIDAIESSKETRYGRWIWAALRWKQTPPAILQIIAHRRDSWFRQLILSRTIDLADPSVSHAIRQIREFTWMNPRLLNVRTLDQAEQKNLVILATSSGISLDAKLDIIGRVLTEGQPTARQAAACSLLPLTGNDVNSLVLQCVHDHDPLVQLAGIQLARIKHLPSLLPLLMSTIDHPNPLISDAAKAGLVGEFNFQKYTRSFDQLDAKSQRSVGQLLEKIEPDLFEQLRAYLLADHRNHQIRGARIAHSLGWADHCWNELLVLAQDEDLIVRRAATDALLSAQNDDFFLQLRSLATTGSAANPRAIGELLLRLRDQGSQPRIREQATQILAQCHELSTASSP
jgi:hypothetical protein